MSKTKLSPELDKTKTEIVSALTALHITKVSVEWSGGGDSGQVDCITAEDEEQGNEIDLEKTGVKEIDEVYEESVDSGKKNRDGSVKYIRVKKTRKVTRNLHEQIEQFAYDLWDHFGQGGWYNNDGGNGSMVFQWDKKTKTWDIKFEHYNNYTESKLDVDESL